ncbi:MAG: hypothetical protein MHM6MM_003435 [Cercozoa sp. M6MM]
MFNGPSSSHSITKLRQAKSVPLYELKGAELETFLSSPAFDIDVGASSTVVGVNIADKELKTKFGTPVAVKISTRNAEEGLDEQHVGGMLLLHGKDFASTANLMPLLAPNTTKRNSFAFGLPSSTASYMPRLPWTRGTQQEGTVLTVMPLAETTLHTRMKEQPDSFVNARGNLTQQALRWFRQLVIAVDSLNNRVGVVHRDVKATNCVLLGGRLALLDYGSAALRGETTVRTGTVEYSAPEADPYSGGDFIPSDVAHDVFGVGTVLADMLLGATYRWDYYGTVFPRVQRNHPNAVAMWSPVVEQHHQALLDRTLRDLASKGFDRETQSLVSRLLSSDPKVRHQESVKRFADTLAWVDARLFLEP